jgi:hypothetical protein
MPVSRELTALIRDTIKPCLGTHGFSHRGHDFLRPVEDRLVHVVSVQRSEHNSPTHVSWTLNIAVFAPELREVRGFPPADRVPDASECFMSIRIAYLLPSDGVKSEFWYELGTDGLRKAPSLDPLCSRYDPLSPESVRRVVRRDLEEAVVPHLDKIPSREALYQWYQELAKSHRAGPLDQIALELALGKIDEARRTWRASLADRPDVREYAKRRFGVDL